MFAEILLGLLDHHPTVVLNRAGHTGAAPSGRSCGRLLRTGGLDRVHVLSLKNMFGLARTMNVMEKNQAKGDSFCRSLCSGRAKRPGPAILEELRRRGVRRP